MPHNIYHIWLHPRQSVKLGRFHSTGIDETTSNPTSLVGIVFAPLGRSTPFPDATNMNEDHLTIIEAWPKCYPFVYPSLMPLIHVTSEVNYKLIIHTIVSGFISVMISPLLSTTTNTPLRHYT